MPILGILASAQVGSISTSSYESISTVTLTSAASSITISSIPGTYKHLQLRTTARAAAAQTGAQSQMRINGDTGSSYTYHNFQGNGASVSADGSPSAYTWSYGLDRFPGGNDLANTFGSAIIDFLDYSNNNKFKTIRALAGYDANGSGLVRYSSSLWMSTSTITSLYFENQGGSQYAAGTQFALYGIKG